MTAEVAPGIYRLGTRWVHYYLIVDGSDAVLVDAGYPGYLPQLEAAMSELGMSLASIQGVLVTHHHVDHAGTAGALHARTGVPIYVGEDDAPLVCGARPSHPPSGFYRQAWRPSMIRYLAHTVQVGGARYRPAAAGVRTVGTDQPLDLPGGPLVVPTPGHTAGHYSVLFAGAGVLCAGDALVNFDYASGRRGVGLHRFNEDRPCARASLARLADVEAETVLFGHGDPWSGAPARAVEYARGDE